jgi:hypothetical protein
MIGQKGCRLKSVARMTLRRVRLVAWNGDASGVRRGDAHLSFVDRG